MAGITTKENVAVQGSAQTHQSGPGVNKQMTANNQNLELMAEQSQNYKRLDEEQYVIRGSILSCNKGKRLIMIDLLKDHGVYTENEQPVLTCKDCKVGENITNFGTCYCQSEETLCSPVISGWWKQAEGRVMIWEESGGIYEAALRDSATLTCQSGGIIEVLEVPDQTALSNQGTGWVKQLDGGWKYLDESSMEYLFSTWKLDQEQWYYFDDNEYMALGWRYYKEAWYYLQEFQSAGYMVVSSWQEHKEKWYYLGFDGKMVTSTWISSKTERGKEYWVDENGVWVDTRENCDIVHALACTTGGANQGALSQSQQEANAQYIYSYLSEENWSMQAICGLLGNIQQESVMNPGAWQGWHKTNLGYGLVQWTKAEDKFLRHYSLTAEAADKMAKNEPRTLMDAQLDYLILTMKNGTEWLPSLTQKYYDKLPLSSNTLGKMTYAEYIASSCDVGDLALVFHATYERSGDDKSRLENRVKYAKTWYSFL